MKLSEGISVHEDWQNHITKVEFQRIRVTGYNPDTATLVPIPLAVTSNGHTVTAVAHCFQSNPEILSLSSNMGSSETQLPLLY